MKISEKQIFEIVEKCMWAPSGDNCQPWTFEWDGHALHIFHNRKRARHPLNTEELASKLSLGCVLQAIEVAATDFQLTSEYALEDTAQNSQNELTLWAKVKFKATEKLNRPFRSEDLLRRSTDRRFYQGGELSRNQFKEIDFQIESFSPAKFHLLPKPSQRLLNLVTEAEQYLIESDVILPETLSWVHFSKNQAKASRDGMLWPNLGIRFWELPIVLLLRTFPPILKIFRPLLRLQNKIRVKRQLKSSAGLICISIPTTKFSDVVEAGRLMMAIWMTLNQKGFGVQPLTISSLSVLCARLGLFELPKKYSELFRDVEAILQEEFSITSGTHPIWMIRTGLSPSLPPELRTLRKSVHDILKIRKSSNDLRR